MTSDHLADPLPPLPDPTTVSVIVPARQGADALARSLPAVLAQTDRSGRPCVEEVVVAVGPSTDGTREVVASFAAQDARVRIVDNPSGRTPDALNLAIAATSGQVVVRVDAQAVLPDGYVLRAIEDLRVTGAANVGGRQLPTAADGFARAVAAAMRSRAGSGGAAYRGGGDAGPVDTVYLGVFRREALEAVGGYDARFTRNQDAELNLRLRAAGYEVHFDPHLAVAYEPRSSPRELASQYLQYGRWRRFTSRVHPGSLQPRQVAAPVLVVGGAGVAALSAATGRWSPLLATGGAYLAACAASVAGAVERPTDLPAAVLAVAVMHASWGVGFLVGPPPSEITQIALPAGSVTARHPGRRAARR